MIYHVPVLSSFDFAFVRSPGPGLGNLLFPIARSIVGQNRFGGEVVYPTMRQFKFGTIIRKERDFRTYGDVFRRRGLNDWGKWLKIKGSEKIDEDCFDVSLTSACVVYKGMKNYFHDLDGFRRPIVSWIESNSMGRGLLSADYDIGIHVRLGDFQQSGNVGDGYSVQQSFGWYREAYRIALDLVGSNKPSVFLFTDEEPQSVSRSLSISGLEVDPSQNAISAIRNLARAQVIITSRSTFSMWAVFLGGRQAVWNRQFNLIDSFPERVGLDHML